jgi:Flp pilus assembly secretin CpaC
MSGVASKLFAVSITAMAMLPGAVAFSADMDPETSLRLAGRQAAPDQGGAEGAVLVNVNMARVLRINAPAATIIIGNPGIADVTIQDPQTLILTGKNYGQTNMIVLGADGEPVADTLIEVVQTHDDIVTMFYGQSRATMTCEPICQPTVNIGDDPDYTSRVIASSTLVENNAE